MEKLVKQDELKKEIKTDLAKVLLSYTEFFIKILPYALFLYFANRHLIPSVYVKTFNRFLESVGAAHATHLANICTALTLITCLIFIYIAFKTNLFTPLKEKKRVWRSND